MRLCIAAEHVSSQTSTIVTKNVKCPHQSQACSKATKTQWSLVSGDFTKKKTHQWTKYPVSAPEALVQMWWTSAEIVMMSWYHQHWRPHSVCYSGSRCMCLGAETSNSLLWRLSERRVLSDVCVSKWMFVCWWLCLEAAVPPWVGYNEEETIQQQILALSAVSKNLIHYITVSTQSLSCSFWLSICSLNVGQEKFLAGPSGWCPVPLRHGADVSSGCSDAGGRPAPQPHALWPGSKTVSTLCVCVCVVQCVFYSRCLFQQVC